MKKFLVIFIALFSINTFGQKPIILISNKYEFQREANSFNINNMLKSILASNNYEVYFDDEVLPIEVAQNRCNALKGVLVDRSNVFLTRVKLQIQDCQNKLLFETAEVKSKEKDIQTAFIEVIKLLSPELKKYNPTIVKKNEVVEKNEIVETPSETIKNTTVKYQFVEIANGYAIMDTTPKVILQIYKTTNPTVFIADKFGVKGIFTKTGNKGVFEYYLNDILMVEEFSF